MSGPWEIRPRDGLRPTPPEKLAGIRIDPPTSEPWAIGTIPALTAACDPPLEPPAENPSRQGLDALPWKTPSVVPAIQNSGTLVRPSGFSPLALIMRMK